jgi:hypothetical protein
VSDSALSLLAELLHCDSALSLLAELLHCDSALSLLAELLNFVGTFLLLQNVEILQIFFGAGEFLQFHFGGMRMTKF